MTATVQPALRLYHSPWGLLPFQLDHLVEAVVGETKIAQWDTGVGKSHLAMAMACLLIEDGLVDRVLLACEDDKIGEWLPDFATYTDLRVVRYQGTPQRRAKLRASDAQVLISTYETFKLDISGGAKKIVKATPPGPLLADLLDRRVLVIHDEPPAKLGSRGSARYKAHDWFVQQVRAHGQVYLLGLTATPQEKSPEQLYDLGRMYWPDKMPTVKDFYARYVASRDLFDRPKRWHHLDEFGALFEGLILRKSKNDPDVIAQFPTTTEDPHYYNLAEAEQEVYDALEVLCDPPEGQDDHRNAYQIEADERALLLLLRQFCCHPTALLTSDGRIAKQVVELAGEDGLRALGSSKVEQLLAYLARLGDAQALLFTFFAPSVIPIIAPILREHGYSVTENHSGIGKAERQRNRDAFKAGEFQLLMSGDSGARGLNFPNATYVIDIEPAITYGRHVQRHARAVRMGEVGQPPVTFRTLIAAGTCEEGIAELTLRENGYADSTLGKGSSDADPYSAADRRRVMRAAQRRNGHR